MIERTYLGINFPLSWKAVWSGFESITLSVSNRMRLEARALRLRGKPTPVGMMYDESSSSLDFPQFVSCYIYEDTNLHGEFCKFVSPCITLMHNYSNFYVHTHTHRHITSIAEDKYSEI
jgi:hypothetical protein